MRVLVFLILPIENPKLDIDEELELRRLLHREIGGLGALQDFVHVRRDAPVAVREVRAVVHEPAGIYSFSDAMHRRQPAL